MLAHLQGLLRRVNLLPGFIGAQHCPLPFPQNPDDIFAIGNESMLPVQMPVETTNVHGVHGSRCHDGNTGEVQCSQAMPQGIVDLTKPVELK